MSAKYCVKVKVKNKNRNYTSQTKTTSIIVSTYIYLQTVADIFVFFSSLRKRLKK